MLLRCLKSCRDSRLVHVGFPLGMEFGFAIFAIISIVTEDSVEYAKYYCVTENNAQLRTNQERSCKKIISKN